MPKPFLRIPAAGLEFGAVNVQSLAKARELFHRLNVDVSYCHWKSNAALERSLLGDGDLDLLVSRDHRERFQQHLHDLRFVRIVATGPKHFNGLEDYIGVDETTGRLLHLHVHYSLVLGEKRVKNHQLPLEEWLLQSTRMLADVRIPQAEHELTLLFIRSILKSDARSCTRALFGRAEHSFPKGVLDELKWLASQVDDSDVLRLCRDSDLRDLADNLERFLRRLRAGRLTPGYVLMQKRILLHKLRRFQRYSTVVCFFRKFLFRLRYSRPWQTLRPVPKKQLPVRGIYLAVTGADGSGKTTLSRDLTTWLGWKLSTKHLYFGQPKKSRVVRWLGRSRKAMLLVATVSERVRLRRAARVLNSLAESARAARWLYIARKRVHLDARARRYVAKGSVVVAERFPLRELWGMDQPMDGPRLQRLPAGNRHQRIATRERHLYDRLSAPDPTIVLVASLPVLRRRKPETPMREHRAKAEAINQLVDLSNYQAISAEQDYAEVLRAAQRCLWQALIDIDHAHPDTAATVGASSGKPACSAGPE